MLSIIHLVLLAAGLLACNFTDDRQGKRKQISYSYACLDSAVGGSSLNRALERTTGIIRDLAISRDSVTDEVQNEYGQAFHEEVLETGTFVLLDDPAMNRVLNEVMHDLLSVREDPSKIEYSIYALDDTTVNAFTFGGRIYVTQAMFRKCGGKTPLLYSIIGHEIGHSEKGHIKQMIQEMILSNQIFGEDNGMTVYQLKRLFTASFNQKHELEADYYGTDLSYQLDQDVCSAVVFWNEMAREENVYSRFEDFFRSHPFSSLRAQCLQQHIRTNFERECPR